MSLAPEFCSDSCVTALTAIGTSLSGLARRVAVLTPRPGRIAQLLDLGEPPADRLGAAFVDRLRAIAAAAGVPA